MKEDFCCIFCKADGKITIQQLIWGGGEREGGVSCNGLACYPGGSFFLTTTGSNIAI